MHENDKYPGVPERIQLMDENGTVHEHPTFSRYVKDVDGDTLREAYRLMYTTRRFDDEATALQRQGQLALWVPSRGQEAAQGYSISHPQITRHLRVAATPFAVSALAERAAVASIEHQDAVMERVKQIVAERERVTARLRELGYGFPSTYANFVWLPLGERTGEFVDLMNRNALSVRAFGSEGVRVSIGEVEANDRFLSLCELFAQKG